MRQKNSIQVRKGFTLLELLTVIAITAILMTIIVVPMMQGFNFVRSAQAFADAQEKGRLVMERISREISNSAGVRDNSGDRGACDVVVPGQDGTLVTIRLPYTKLDIMMPAREGRVDANGIYNPYIGKYDPTLRSKKGQMVLPVAPGDTMVRYFIGLRDPFNTNGYVNPYDGLLMSRSSQRDNMYVLYRAEVTPIVYVGGVPQPNARLFEVSGGKPVLDDPSFFIWDGSDPTVAGTKGNRIANWVKDARIVTEISRYDMIMPIYDKALRQVTYDGNIPRLLPLVQFRPTRVASEPAKGTETARLSIESEGMNDFASSVFLTKLGAWSNTIIRTYPSGWANGLPYLVGRAGGTTNVSIFYFDPATDTDENQDGIELFDVTRYENAVTSAAAADRYHFTLALNAAGLSNATRRANFIPYFLDSHSGKVYANFGIWEVGTDTSAANNNLPLKASGPQITPTSSGPLGSAWSSYTTINEQFVKAWQEHPELRPKGIHRFIDLRVTPNADGTASPLDPDPTIGFARASIMPGSEEVFGPDQTPGPNYGRMVRYYRTTGEPGPNQYRINYVNLAEPTDYSLLGLPNPPATYDPDDFMSVAYQSRFKVGYIQLNSDPNVPLPDGNFSIRYRFQFTKQGDAIAVDYDSRQIMQILLTMRNFPQTSEPNPQGITLKTTATVRNYLR